MDKWKETTKNTKERKGKERKVKQNQTTNFKHEWKVNQGLPNAKVTNFLH